ncbi:MAG: fimbrillin family protein [Prevotella sp.]|jgi:hypothetical protein
MKVTRHFFTIFLLDLALALTGCADGLLEDSDVASGGLSFSVSTESMATSGDGSTRASAIAGSPTPFNHTLKGNEVYLRTSSVPAIGQHATSQTVATRGGMITSDNFYDSFYVAGYDTSTGTDAFGGIHTATRTNGWAFGEGWPDDDSQKFKFYAYAPIDIANDNLVVNDEEEMNTVNIGYTVPENVINQQDLLAAISGEVSRQEAAVPLTFKHLLTCVRFAIDKSGDVKEGITIKKIIIHGVKKSGVYTQSTNSWTVNDATGAFTYNLNLYIDTQNQYIESGDQMFMLMPQTVPSGAYVELQYKDADSDDTQSITADISGHSWPQGYTVTYHVTTSGINPDYELTVSPDVNYAYSGDGSASTFTVTSYNKNGDTAEPWTIDGYSTDGGANYTTTCPSWLTLGATSGDGSTTGESASLSVTARTTDDKVWASLTHHDALANSTVSGGDDWLNAVDLSLRDAYGNTLSARNTANCYVVRGPGWYKIPMVFGNSLKDGKANADARSTINTGDNILQNFVDCDGNAVKKTWINVQYDWPGTSASDETNNGTTRRAAVIWKDIQADVIPQDQVATDISNGEGYIRFYVDPANIYQGNVVIGLYDSNAADAKVVWSWHIWITDENLTTVSVTNTSGSVNKMMPVPLGFIDQNEKSWSWPERSVVVRIKQTNSGKTALFTVTQHQGRYLEGYSPYYQWGRKDPMPAVGTVYFPGASGNVLHTQPSSFYSASTELLTTYTVAGAIAASIQNPTVMYCDHNTSPNNWLPSFITNLWDVSNTTADVYDTQVTKSIYDPCPYPFHVPNAGVYTGFVDKYTADGTNSDMTYWNVAETTYHNGWNFYTEPDASRTYNTIFVAAQGYSTASGGGAPAITSKETVGGYWTSGYKSVSTGRAGALYYYYESSESKDLSPLSNSNDHTAPWTGYSIIPTTE